MVHYRPYVDAIQWLGTNIIPVRQFVNSSPGVIRTGVIRDGVLYITQVGSPIEIPVPVNNWLVRSGFEVFTLEPTEFDLKYVLDNGTTAVAR